MKPRLGLHAVAILAIVALSTLVLVKPELIGGSADLTGSNNTLVKGTVTFDAPDYEGRYVNWGIREHGMAAAMNGMALHGGIIPYSGTFLVFADYCRPSIRLAALMGERVIHVMTHDSIGLGEDGPTHQPVETLASLRAMPNLNVFRPCDAVETLECWQLALEGRETPSVLALTRQNLPQLRRTLDDLSERNPFAEHRTTGGEHDRRVAELIAERERDTRARRARIDGAPSSPHDGDEGAVGVALVLGVDVVERAAPFVMRTLKADAAPEPQSIVEQAHVGPEVRGSHLLGANHTLFNQNAFKRQAASVLAQGLVEPRPRQHAEFDGELADGLVVLQSPLDT